MRTSGPMADISPKTVRYINEIQRASFSVNNEDWY